MQTIRDSAASRFDHLFHQLLATLEQERELRSTGNSVVELIDVMDRLHTLRAELAPLRRQLGHNLGVAVDEASSEAADRDQQPAIKWSRDHIATKPIGSPPFSRSGVREMLGDAPGRETTASPPWDSSTDPTGPRERRSTIIEL